VDIKETSVSGVSSGAVFSVQMQVAFSSIIKGAGIIAGGPYDCGEQMVAASHTICSSAHPQSHYQSLELKDGAVNLLTTYQMWHIKEYT